MKCYPILDIIHHSFGTFPFRSLNSCHIHIHKRIPNNFQIHKFCKNTLKAFLFKYYIYILQLTRNWIVRSCTPSWFLLFLVRHMIRWILHLFGAILKYISNKNKRESNNNVAYIIVSLITLFTVISGWRAIK